MPRFSVAADPSAQLRTFWAVWTRIPRWDKRSETIALNVRSHAPQSSTFAPSATVEAPQRGMQITRTTEMIP